MNLYDNEEIILEFFRYVSTEEVLFLNHNKETEDIFEKIHSEDNWNYWINNSKKSDPPPDFFSNKFNLMMEVMRIDDHAHENAKGKIVNPTNQRESKLQKELKDNGIFEAFPNIKYSFVNAITDLATEDDHNYDYYLSNFKRSIEKHNAKVTNYKENHNNKKMIFFLLDESSAYFEATNDNRTHSRIAGTQTLGQPHFHFLDEKFIDTILKCDIDYFIWYSPYKILKSDIRTLSLPKICIVDISSPLDDDFVNVIKHYNKNKMISTEV